MAAATKPPVVDEEIDPTHPQFQNGVRLGALAALPRSPGPDAAAPVAAQSPSIATANVGGALNGLPRTVGPSPAVGGTQAVLPPPINLPRKRTQNAVQQPDPREFFRRRAA